MWNFVALNHVQPDVMIGWVVRSDWFNKWHCLPLQKIQLALQDQKKNIDYLNSTGDKFLKTLPRQKLEQLRSKLTDVNNKWKDVTMGDREAPDAGAEGYQPE